MTQVKVVTAQLWPDREADIGAWLVGNQWSMEQDVHTSFIAITETYSTCATTILQQNLHPTDMPTAR